MTDDKIGAAIEYSKILLEQFKIQREVQDRWFRFYLILIGAPLAAMLTLVQVESIRSATRQMYSIIALFSTLVFLIGIFFLLMYIRQRINSLVFIKRMNVVNSFIVSESIPEKLDELAFSSPFVSTYGADFFVNSIHILLNSSWFTVAVVFFGASIRGVSAIETIEIAIGLSAFFLVVFLQAKIRSTMLSKFNESIQ